MAAGRAQEKELATAITGEHRERKNGIGAGHCVACREKWPCKPYQLAVIVLDVTEAI